MTRMRVVAVAAAAAVVVVAAVVLAVVLRDGSPDPAPSAAPSAAPAARLMPLGDSLTAETPGFRDAVRAQLVAAGRRVDLVGSQRAPSDDPEHEGHEGLRTDELAADATGWVSAASPDVVMVLSGTNDLMQSTPPATVATRLRTLLDAVWAGAPEARVVVASPPPQHRGYDPAPWAEYARSVGAIAAEYEAAGKPVEHVDLSASLTEAETSDGVHPTEAGAAKIAALWVPAVSAALDTLP